MTRYELYFTRVDTWNGHVVRTNLWGPVVYFADSEPDRGSIVECLNYLHAQKK